MANIQIENRGRQVWRFPILVSEDTPRGPILRESGESVVIGDSADRILAEGVERDPRFTPNPQVEITAAQWDGIGLQSREVIRTLIARDVFSGKVPPEPKAAPAAGGK